MPRHFSITFLRYGLMFGRKALDQSHGSAEHGRVAFEYAFDKFSGRWEGLASDAAFQIWVYDRRLGHSAVDGQPFVCVVVFRMLHGVGCDWLKVIGFRLPHAL